MDKSGPANNAASPAASGRTSKLTVLRLGFGAMVCLLVFSAVEAYRIQHAAAGQSAKIYHRFAQHVDIQNRIRRALYLGSIHSRDYMLSNRADRLETLQQQLEEVKAEAGAGLEQLQIVAGSGASFAALREKVNDLWATIESTPQRTRGMKGDQLYDYVLSEIVPRRNAAGAFLRELEEVNASALRESEAEFEGSRRNALWRLLGIMGVCVLLGLVVTYLSLRHSTRLEEESVQRFEEVAEAKKDLEQLSARLLEIQEDERRRIARELHDEIGQTLTALRIEISRAQAAWNEGSPATQSRLEEARSLAERTVSTVRDISLLLRPALLDDLGLAAALQWHVEQFSRRSGIRCLYSEEGIEDSMPDAVNTCVYRVVQEALNNCEKHSAASEVRLSVRQTGRRIAIEIEDNGRGIVLDRHGNPQGAAGLGIMGMRERVSALGGSLRLESARGRGTRVWLSLALPEQAPAAAAELSA